MWLYLENMLNFAIVHFFKWKYSFDFSHKFMWLKDVSVSLQKKKKTLKENLSKIFLFCFLFLGEILSAVL